MATKGVAARVALGTGIFFHGPKESLKTKDIGKAFNLLNKSS